MHLTLHVWRQKSPTERGGFVRYETHGISPHMSFLEMLDVVNEDLAGKGEEPIAFDHDCREGICGMCGMVVNGRPHGPRALTTTCQPRPRAFVGRLGGIQAILGHDAFCSQAAHALQVRLRIARRGLLFTQMGPGRLQAGVVLTQHLIRAIALHLKQHDGATLGALFRLQHGLRLGIFVQHLIGIGNEVHHPFRSMSAGNPFPTGAY